MKYIIAPSSPGYEYSKTSRCIEKNAAGGLFY